VVQPEEDPAKEIPHTIEPPMEEVDWCKFLEEDPAQ
jgi:hypothetical protein